MTIPTSSKHWIVTALPFFGHSRPLIGLICNLLTLDPTLHVTFISSLPFHSQTLSEFSAYSLPSGPSSRLLIISIANPTPSPDPELEITKGEEGTMLNQLAVGFAMGFRAWDEAIVEAVEQIFEGGKVWCQATEGWKECIKIRPSRAIADCFNYGIYDAIESARIKFNQKERIPIYGFGPAPLSAWTQHFAPEELGGTVARWKPRYEKFRREHPDWSQEKAMNAAHDDLDFEVVDIPGCPPIYDYEYFPQTAAPLPHFLYFMLFRSAKFIAKIDGFIGSVTGELELPGAKEGFLKGLGRQVEVLTAGPQFPAQVWDRVKAKHVNTSVNNGNDHSGRHNGSGNGNPNYALDEDKKVEERGADKPDEVMDFLNSAQEKYGDKSVLYISFGSIFFPVFRMDLIVSLVDALIEHQMPFVFALAAPPAQAAMEGELTEKIKASGLGITTKFAPQREVLEHPATGWILTHCGSNSWSEAMLYGVPQILWPCAADQPVLAALASKRALGTGIELVQVRTGLSVGQMSSYGVKCEGTPEAARAELLDVVGRIHKGEEEQCRANVQKASKVIIESWETGLGKEAIDRLIAMS